jgi:glycosyltransferase involved in cell wall biosynthesis
MKAQASSLKVVHVTPAYFGDGSVIGGGERYATELARAMSCLTPTRLVSFSDMAEMRDAGFKMQDRASPIVHPASSLDVQLFNPIWYARGQKTNPVSFSFLQALDDADVIHCHQFHIVATTLSILYGSLMGKGVFVTDLGGGGWDISYRFNVGQWVDGFLHISDFSAQLEANKYAGKHHVIYGGVDTNKFRPTGSERRNSVLYVGRLLPHKGINYLIEAMDRQTELRIIGRHWEPQLKQARGQEFFDLLKRLADGKRVSFIGEADDAQLVKAYSSALVTVLPSVYTDVFGEQRTAPELLGLTLLESMACGTPVIATNVGGMSEIVEDGTTGFIVPPNDAQALADRIEWLAANPSRAQQMGERGRERVLEKFTWEATARRCLDVYAGNRS